MRLRLVAGALVALAALGGCGDDAPEQSRAPAPEEITGPVTKVDSESIGDVTSFEVRHKGDVFQVFIDPEIDYGFNLSHINEHLASGDPVRVGLEEQDGKLYATVIADA